MAEDNGTKMENIFFKKVNVKNIKNIITFI